MIVARGIAAFSPAPLLVTSNARRSRRNAHEVFEIYAIDYSALSGDFWGTPCEAVVFAERLNFKLAVIFPRFISVTVHFVVNKGAPLQIQQS
jgi:hypothetical protein